MADAVLPLAVALAHRAPPSIVRYAIEEALFREHELPNRTKKFREAYLKKNGGK